jgi:glycosyltransferase involved in cell wall biosynthesis
MIYVCIPTRNEAPTVGLLIWKIRQAMSGSSREYQVLVGDDASTDKTSEVLGPYANVLPLTVLRSEQPMGYAATVERLLKEALKLSDRHKRDSAILLPADYTVDPVGLEDFLKKIDSGADLVIGEARLVGEPDRARRLIRRWASRLLGRRVRVPGVRDIVSGVAAFRLVTLRQAFRSRPDRWLTVEGWAANAELMSWSAAGARSTESVFFTERVDRRQRTSRNEPWPLARELWQARRHLVAPEPSISPAGERRPHTPQRSQEQS